MNRLRTNLQNKGVTLIEALVAISIFTVAILTILVVLSQGITNTNYAKTKIIASYLAQEGIEYIRNMRDTMTIYEPNPTTGWNTFNNKLTTGSCNTGNGCYFDDQSLIYTNPFKPIAGIPVTVCGASCPPLLYNSANGKYGYASGTNSGFVRKIFIETLSANETRIYSTVSWTQGSGNYSMTFSESLFNWPE